MKQIFENIVENLIEYIRKNGLKSMVLGLSGGIDSTVCAVICREVANRMQGEVSFIGVSLPSKSNANDENMIAKVLGKGLCDTFVTHEIDEEYNAVLNQFQRSLVGVGIPVVLDSLQRGNLKARLRMMYLYNLASMNKGIVIDTDNMTEHYLGFWTIHGDVGDVNPIGKLWKMEVYDLAKWCLNNVQMEDTVTLAVEASIAIEPTDGNAVKTGGDLAQIAPGLTYKEVDEVLRNEVCETDNARKAAKRDELRGKYSAKLVDGIISRHRNSEYKRVRLPIVIEI